VVDGQLRLVNGANVAIKPATSEPSSTAAAPPRG
jgi:multidrug efflux system membrane fusion protein